MKKFIATLFILGSVCSLSAQTDPGHSKWMEYIEEMAENEADENTLENLFSDLSHLSENPFDLHTVRKQDLEKLPFLSDMQIENLLYYVYRYAPLTSIYELKNIDGLDMQTIEYLLPFIYIGEKGNSRNTFNTKNILRYGKQEVLLRYDRCFQEKAGYRNDPEEEKAAHPNRYYLGEPYYTSLKYGFQYKDRLQFGLVGEKDPGEAFWNKQHKGFDYYSVHAVIREFGILKSLFLGDYRPAFGQGLVINTDFSMLNTSDVMNTGRNGGGFKRHYSTSEANYFRGAAATVELRNTIISLFYSQRKIDASVDNQILSSIKTDGYHRTPDDLLKKDKAKARVTGGNIQWKNDFLSCGLTAAYYDYGGLKSDPDPKPYNLYYLRGSSFYNAGCNYLWRRKKFLFQGETAMGKNGAWASQNSLQVYPASFFNFILRQCYFAKNYQAQYASAAGSSSVQNINSWYVGAVLQPLSGWKISVSADRIEYPWLKYLIDSPSKAANLLAQLEYIPQSSCSMSIRYKQKEKMKNTEIPGQATKAVVPSKQHSLRYQLNIQKNNGIYSKTQLNGNLYLSTGNSTSKGWMLSESIGYAAAEFPLHPELYVAYFHTSDWNSRISTYEKSILYAFSAPSFSGEGLRSCLNCKWPVTSQLSLYIKFAWTHYTDRETISSSLEAIEGKNKMDFYGLIKYKF